MLRQRRDTDPYVQIQKEIVMKYKDPNRTSTSNNTLNGTSHIPTFTQFLLKARDDVKLVW